MPLQQSSDLMIGQRASQISFVWRPREITPAVLQMAQRTGCRAIFDFSLLGVDGIGSWLGRTDPAGQVRDIKISLPAFLDPALGPLLQETGVENLWVECPPRFMQGDPSLFLQRLRELAAHHRCFPITGDLDLLAAMLQDHPGVGRIVLKGCEASGFVGAETTTVLYAMLKELLPKPAKPLDILIWGGVATPEAAAAFLSTGAAGIVFESLHWLTDLVAADDVQHQRLARLRLDATDLVGVNLQVPCRLFNKGNSLAFKEIHSFEASLFGAKDREECRRAFVSQVQAKSIHPLESRFGPDEVIPLGVEAAFAESFVERFGAGTEVAVPAFLDEIRSLCRQAEAKKAGFLDSPVAAEMGTRYPFIQGAMSWITDVPEFAACIADAGGLPTIALGLMDAAALDKRLGRLPEIMGGRPYALNVVTLAENPFRELHLAWIKQQRPRFVVIAGGDLSPLRGLIECGLEVIYLAPDEALLRLALEAGVRYVACEGYEAGGHVGRHSTLTLAQAVLELKRRTPSLFQNSRVILAGGIFNRETAFIAAMLGADAIQMGTAYLATREIVATGALTALYQRLVLGSPPGGTVVSGQETGLRVRSLRTPRTKTVLSLEREFAVGDQGEASFRTRMEEMASRSLFIAARGRDRSGQSPLDEETCLERGQFMVGSCAGLIREVRELQAFHRDLAEGPLLLPQPGVGEFEKTVEPAVAPPPPMATPAPAVSAGRQRVAPSGDTHKRIAITGMSIINALGKSPEEVLAASLAMQSGFSLVPPSRWDHSYFYDPRPQVPDRTYCNVGAFLDFQVSRTELGIPPQDFRSMTSATKLTLWLADQALRVSGLLESDIPRERIAVIIAQNSGEAAGTLNRTIIRAYSCDILAAVKKAVHLTPEQSSAVEREIKAGRMAPDDTTLLGRLNCAAPGFICNRYGIKGPSFAVSAACSSSLVALYNAMQLIRNGIIDAAVVGGGEEDLTPLHFLEFAAVGALYGLSGRLRPAPETSRPFDAQRDGLVLGEGGGMLVIERENLARARGARINALITGMGASNSWLGMVESASVTQELAIGASFQGLPYGPDAVDLVECHATSTRQGDVQEVRGLKTFFKPSKRTVLTSFKSQIGHTLGASGISNLIRGAMAMQAGVFPATLNYEHPDPEMGLQGSGFLIAPEPLDWKRRAGEPRRFQANAFGFGGSNYVVQVEQALDDLDTVLVAPGRSAGFAEEPDSGPPALQGLAFFRTELDGSHYRMAVVAGSESEALTRLEGSVLLAEGGSGSPRALRSLAQQGIYLSREDAPVLPLAFVFPGQGSQYAGMGQELYETFPVIREWMDRAAAAAEFDLLHLMFHDREENLQKTRWQQPALFAMEHAMARYLVSLGMQPVAMAGHSLGELTALCLAGVFSVEDGFRIVNQRALCMDKAAVANVDPGVMAATDAPLALLQELLQGQEAIHISNINSPQQIVLGGATEELRTFGNQLRELGHRSTFLRVSMAFHTPIMRVIHDELEAYVASMPFFSPRIPVISNTTRAPYPEDPAAIKRILMSHLESPVHWLDNAKTLWNDFGVRLFMEVGPGEALSNLIEDTLPEPVCLQSCLPAAEGSTWKTALAQLFVQGHLPIAGEPRWLSLGVPVKTPETPPLPAAGSGQAPPVDNATPVAEDLLERLIGLIMEATGFERDEIGPDMDLRKDLSIRSSRLPIIMDAAERQFAITIEMEDFIEVRTVRDIARQIAGIIARQGGAELPPSTGAVGPATAGPEQTSPVANETPVAEDLLERLIGIIMEATGFERDEIGPDMDLRKDLSIRSSRLPIIMDAAERQFAITIEMEDFIEVRTVRDIARRIAGIIAGPGEVGLQPATGAAASDPERDEMRKPAGTEASLKRMVFNQVPIESAAAVPVELSPGESVLLLSADLEDRIGRSARDIFRRDYGVDTLPMLFLAGDLAPGEEGYDLLTEAGSGRAAESIAGRTNLAGMVIFVPPGRSEKLRGMADVSGLLRGLFLPLQAFLRSPNKKFVIFIHGRGETDTSGQLLAEGMLGLFLSAAQEYPSVQFRSLAIERDTDLRAALRGALDRGCSSVEIVQRGGRFFTSAGRVAPAVCGISPGLQLSHGDVVVLSGGATGIGAVLARSLAPFTPRLIFLGRTTLPPGPDSAGPHPGPPSAATIAADPRSVEIARTLADLHAAGVEADYHACDVTDSVAVRAVLGEVVSRYGRIDGIIHGAGVLRDGFLSQMTAEDFSLVTEVKFLGAWNLFSAAQGAGLRFFVGLSSAAAIQGNPGQTNYAAGNRMMSALLTNLRRENGAIRFKALMLPPIEGAGMADDPELRELLQRKGVGYIHVNELAGLFCRELLVAPADDVWVMFMRTLPPVKTAPRLDTSRPSIKGELAGGTLSLRPEGFPLIEEISGLDLRREELEAGRTFSREKDLWIADHRPFRFIEHPLVSATMVLETFMEAARILYPHLQVRGVRQVRLMDMLQCPPGLPRPARISCRRVAGGQREIGCEVSLAAREITPGGGLTDRFTPHFRGQVILTGGGESPGGELADFPVRPEELRTGPMEQKNVLKWYQDRSGLEGRYRVIERLDGVGPGVVRGRTSYRESSDFADLRGAEYQYSPYLCEALLQLAAFHLAATDPSERRALIPQEIGEMRFLRQCRDGEQLILEARLRAQDDTGLAWDARGVDEQGQSVMQIQGLRMHWVSA